MSLPSSIQYGPLCGWPGTSLSSVSTWTSEAWPRWDFQSFSLLSTCICEPSQVVFAHTVMNVLFSQRVWLQTGGGENGYWFKYRFLRSWQAWKMNDSDTEETLYSFFHLLFTSYIWHLIVYNHFHDGDTQKEWLVSVGCYLFFLYVNLVKMVGWKRGYKCTFCDL